MRRDSNHNFATCNLVIYETEKSTPPSTPRGGTEFCLAKRIVMDHGKIQVVI